ncbi:glutamyl-tRNA reductase [Megasphaera sp. DJF_B143]|uniref:glutamyl-tRNA reductase n=1 Tax=Megasphaera sp. DJF_B143 TaxID=537288 RepID=UPI00073F7A47|nr:glutamyl-tRNA reductase [Megasphaera sp. DJF_B143]KUH56785.1 glutamyl-tRNA reductase [Megasphaera sp. DJF_B143]
MELFVWGLNHKTVPVSVREQFSVPPERIRTALSQSGQYQTIHEAVILSTCNRSEIYAVCPEGTPARVLQDFFLSLLNGKPEIRLDYFYTYTGRDCIVHLLRVASSLDSQIIGEGQILSQVKQAYLLAHDCGATGIVLNLLFHQAIATGKRVRTDTHIAYNAVSVSYAAVQLAEHLLGDVTGKTLLLFGAGQMAELAARNFLGKGLKKLYIVNRHIERAQKLASLLSGTAVHYQKGNEAAARADIIVTSTGAPHYVLTEERLAAIMKARKGRPLLLIDIAVPRDIEPSAADLPGISLYNIDDLTTTVAENEQSRQREAALAGTIVQEETEELLQRFRYLPVRPALLRLSKKAEQARKREFRRAMNKLPGLTDEQYRIIENMTHMIVRKLLRDPMMQTVGAARTDKEEETVRSLSDFFKL